tara:strand:- start:251 stop:364 length:114 start_codon:yes stop_codon:yes gene_type:complete
MFNLIISEEAIASFLVNVNILGCLLFEENILLSQGLR